MLFLKLILRMLLIQFTEIRCWKPFRCLYQIQQEDPLGPLLFCLSIYQLLLQLKTELCLLYLDVVTLGGKVEDVLHDREVVRRNGEELGLI